MHIMDDTKHAYSRRLSDLWRSASTVVFIAISAWFFVNNSLQSETSTHGLVGLRPLSRTTADHAMSHGGSWQGTPTYADQKGNYPFCAEHVDILKGWLDGDFKTKVVFFEHYWGLSEERDDLDPQKNLLIKTIQRWEGKGGTVHHILMAREYRLAIHRGHKNAKPGPFKEDTRILSEEDVANIRQLFKDAHKEGLIRQDNYNLIMMVEHPSFFADDSRVHPIIEKMEGVAYECHQFNRHWPLETGWSNPEAVIRGAKWTLAQNKDYIFYYGPIIWKKDTKRYYEYIERDWLKTYWAAGLPKHHPKMHYYLNTFPNGSGRMRPIGPESDPHSVLGFTKWMIEAIKQPE